MILRVIQNHIKNHSFLFGLSMQDFFAPTKLEETLLQPNNMRFFGVVKHDKNEGVLLFPRFFRPSLILEAHHIFSRFFAIHVN